jgi:Peptidyl-tRNA hydrolase PTH2
MIPRFGNCRSDLSWRRLTVAALGFCAVPRRLPNFNMSDRANAYQPSKPVVQFIVVRTDLVSPAGPTDPPNAVPLDSSAAAVDAASADIPWPRGALAAQVAHASVAAIAQGAWKYHDPPSMFYVQENELSRMTKIVYGVPSEHALLQVRDSWFATHFILQGEDEESTDSSTVPTSVMPKTIEGLESMACAHGRWKVGKGYLWVEQPENIPTAFATWPIERTNSVSKLFKKLNLSFLS